MSSQPLIGPLVSIVLPVRDWRSTTATAVQSILDQTHQHFELLLVGQSDTDSLARRLHRAGVSDPRIRLLGRHRTGIVGALNTGLGKAQGEFIARMDDDDVADARRLSFQLQYLQEHADVHLCAARVRFIDDDGTQSGVGAGNQRYASWLNQLTTPDEIALACYAENPMPHPTLIAHRNVWEQLGGYREVDGPEDHDLILRAMLLGIGMGKPHEVLHDWREHANRLTYTDSRYRRQAFVTQSVWALIRSGGVLRENTERGVWIAGAGKQARYWHDELVEQGVTVRGFVDLARPGADRQKRALGVISYEQLAAQRKGELLISAVTQVAGREAIKAWCVAQGWSEGQDFIIGG